MYTSKIKNTKFLTVLLVAIITGSIYFSYNLICAEIPT